MRQETRVEGLISGGQDGLRDVDGRHPACLKLGRSDTGQFMNEGEWCVLIFCIEAHS